MAFSSDGTGRVLEAPLGPGVRGHARLASNRRLVAYHAMNHAEEKVNESEQERHVNAKTFFDAAIVKMDDLGLLTPASERTSGPKLPSDSVRFRDGKSIYSRGKTKAVAYEAAADLRGTLASLR